MITKELFIPVVLTRDCVIYCVMAHESIVAQRSDIALLCLMFKTKNDNFDGWYQFCILLRGKLFVTNWHTKKNVPFDF